LRRVLEREEEGGSKGFWRVVLGRGLEAMGRKEKEEGWLWLWRLRLRTPREKG
jgi:hypothetical protein